MRLRSREHFAAAMKRGRRFRGAFVRGHFVPITGVGPSLGIVAGRRVGRATTRNRLKRSIRAVFAAERGALALGAWVIVLLPAAAHATRRQFREELTRCLQSATT